MQDDEIRFPPRVFLQEEIEERGWNLEQFAREASLQVAELQAIFDGAPVTARVAEGISKALGTGPEIWLNLQKMHDEDAGNESSRATG